MTRHHGARKRRMYELSQKNPWYLYEWNKKYLSSQRWETEVQELAKNLKI